MDIAINQTTGDIDVLNNEIYLIDGVDAMSQQVSIACRLFLGEWFLDTTIGMPWFQDILIKGASFPVVQQVMKDTILNIPGVIGLSGFTADFDFVARNVVISFSAQTQQGEINFSQKVDIPVAA